MSTSRNFIFSLQLRNGFASFSLLLIFLFSMSFYACSSSKSVVSGKDTSDGIGETTMSKKRSEVVHFARSYIGTKYIYAGKDPKGFDCSGFTYYVMKKNGIQLNGSSHTQAGQGSSIDIKNLEGGDLIFFGKPSKITHVGIVTNNNSQGLFMIHSSSSRGIVEENISYSDYWQQRIVKGKRVLN